MTRTLKSIAEEIAMHLNRDLDIPLRMMLEDKIDSWRSSLLRRTLEKNAADVIYFSQSVYADMVLVSNTPDCKDIPGLCKVYESKLAIPVPLRATADLFDFVGSVDRSTTFYPDYGTVGSYMRKGKYSKTSTYYRYVNSKIRIEADQAPPVILVEGVFDKPSEVMRFKCGDKKDCDYSEENYPATGDLIQLIVQSILQIDFAQGTLPKEKEIPVDNGNNKQR